MTHYTEIKPDDLLENKVNLSEVDLLTTDDIGTAFGRKKGKVPTWYAFIIYYLTGSSNKATDYLKNNHVQTKRGAYLTPNVILFGAWEWLAYNIQYAKKFLEKDFIVMGRTYNDEVFYIEMLRRMCQYKVVMTDANLIEWMLANDLTDEKWYDRTREKRPFVYNYFKSRSN